MTTVLAGRMLVFSCDALAALRAIGDYIGADTVVPISGSRGGVGTLELTLI